jgi:hypothetical protein
MFVVGVDGLKVGEPGVGEEADDGCGLDVGDAPKKVSGRRGSNGMRTVVRYCV